MTSGPWLSIVTPTHNGRRHLSMALESVAAQADDGIEIIAVDDASTDGTTDILRAYAERLPMRILHHRRQNWVAGTNLGLREATAPYACFLHQDDAWLPGRIGAIRSALERDDADLLIHPVRMVDGAGRRVGTWRPPLPAGPVGSPTVVRRLLVQNFISIVGAVFRLDRVLADGGLDEDLWYTADWDLWLRLAASGAVVHLPRELAAFRVHPEAQTARRSGDLGDLRRQHEIVLERHLPRAGGARAEIERAARFSIEVNLALAAVAHRRAPDARSLLRTGAGLGWRGLRAYLRDARIHERLGARVRARGSARRSTQAYLQ